MPDWHTQLSGLIKTAIQHSLQRRSSHLMRTLFPIRRLTLLINTLFLASRNYQRLVLYVSFCNIITCN